MNDEERGALFLGAILGDALGAPAHGLKHGHIQQLVGGRLEGFHPSGILYTEKPEKNRLPGLHSSTGQQLLAARAAGWEDGLGRGPAAKCAHWLRELAGEAEDLGFRWGALREPGRPLRRALSRWTESYPWEDEDHFAPEEPSEGAGPAVFGLAAESPAQAMSLARLTHTKAYPVLAAWVVARAAELIPAGGGAKIPAGEIARQLLADLEPVEAEYVEANRRHWRDIGWGRPLKSLAYMLSLLPSLLVESNDDLALRSIVNTAEEAAPDFKVTHPQHGFAPTALCWALYRALGPMPPALALEDVVNRGGETCTIGAIVGGLQAKRFGAGHLPEEWLECLCVGAGVNLANITQESEFQAWVSREIAWTEEEESLRAPLREELRKRQKLEAERDRLKPKPKPKTEQGELGFAPPPGLWLEPDAEDDPREKRKMKAARGRKRIDWKEQRREKQREEED